VGNDVVMVDEIPFPQQITTAKPLSLLGYGTQYPPLSFFSFFLLNELSISFSSIIF